jgi:4-carboxymuconolactone decarboxylase
MATVTDNHEAALKAIARREAVIERLIQVQESNIEASGLDRATYALVKIAALITMDAAPASFVWQVNLAREAGVTPAEMTGVLVALAPTIGIARTVAAAPELALALGIEFEEDDQEEEEGA